MDDCIKCASLKKQVEDQKQKHMLDFRTIKQKIISTDTLIRSFQEKCEENIELKKYNVDLTGKLEGSQRSLEVLRLQLKASLEQKEPLQKKCKELEETVSADVHEIQTLKDRVRGSENLVIQLKDVIKENETLANSFKLDAAIHSGEMDELKKTQKKNAAQISKLTNKVQMERKANQMLKKDLTKSHAEIDSLRDQIKEFKLSKVNKKNQSTQVDSEMSDGRTRLLLNEIKQLKTETEKYKRLFDELGEKLRETQFVRSVENESPQKDFKSPISPRRSPRKRSSAASFKDKKLSGFVNESTSFTCLRHKNDDEPAISTTESHCNNEKNSSIIEKIDEMLLDISQCPSLSPLPPSPLKFCDESLCADEDNSININDNEQADQNVIDETMDICHLDDKDFYSVNENKDHQTALVDFSGNIISHSFDQSDKEDVNGISHCDKVKVNIIDHSNKEINCIGPCNKEEVNSSVHSDKFTLNGVDHSDSKEVNSIDQNNKYEVNRIDQCDIKEYICIGHSNKEVTIENLNQCKGNKRQLDFSSASEPSGTFMTLRSRKKRRVNEQVPSMLQTETMSTKLATKNESLNEELGNDPPITRRRSREMGIKINELKPRGRCRKHPLSIKNKDDERSSTVLDQISNNAQFPKSAAHVHDGEENISQPVEEVRQCLATETVSSKGVTKQFSDSYDQDNFCQDGIHSIDDNDVKKTDKAHSSLQPSNDEVEEYSKNLVNLQVSSLDIDQDNYENCVDKLQSSYHQLKEQSENHSNEQECCENEDEEQSKNLSHMQQSCYDQDQEKFHDQSVQLRCVNDQDQKQSQDRLDQQQSIKHQSVEQSLNQSDQQQSINDESHEQSQDQLDQEKSVSYQGEEQSHDLSDQQQFILDKGQEKSKDLLDQQPSCYDQDEEQCINERDQKQSMDLLDHQPFINDQGEEQSNNQLDQQRSCYDHGQEQLVDQPDEQHFSNNKDKGQSDNLLDLQQDQDKSENRLDKQHYGHGKFFGKKVPSTNFCNMVQLDEDKTTSGHVEIVDKSSENRDLDIFMQSSKNGVEKICRTINSTNRERTETTDDKSKYSYRKCGVTVCLDEKNSETLDLPEETVKNMSQDQVRSVVCKNVKTPTSKSIHKSSLTPTAVSKMSNTNKGRCEFELLTSANETSNLPCSTGKSQVAMTSCKKSLIPNKKEHLSVSFEERLLEELSPIPSTPEKIRPVDSPETIRRPFDTTEKTRRSIDTPEKIKSVNDCNFAALDYPPLSPIPPSPTKTEQLAASAHVKMKNSVCGFAKDLAEVNEKQTTSPDEFSVRNQLQVLPVHKWIKGTKHCIKTNPLPEMSVSSGSNREESFKNFTKKHVIAKTIVKSNATMLPESTLNRYSGINAIQFAVFLLTKLKNGEIALNELVTAFSRRNNFANHTPICHGIVQVLELTTEEEEHVLIQKYAEQCQDKITETSGEPVVTDYEMKLFVLIHKLCNVQRLSSLPIKLIKCIGMNIGSLFESGQKECGVLALSRVYTGVCRLVNRGSYVRLLCYDVLKQNKQFELTEKIILAVALTWPDILGRSTKSIVFRSNGLTLSGPPYHPFLATTHVIVMSRDTTCQETRCLLQRLCGWCIIPKDDHVFEWLAKDLLRVVRHICGPSIKTFEQEVRQVHVSFETLKSLELLAIIMDWKWANDVLIREVLWPHFHDWRIHSLSRETKLQNNLGDVKTPDEDKMDFFIAHIIRLLGFVCGERLQKGIFVNLEPIKQLLCALLCGYDAERVSLCVQQSAAYALLDLFPIDSAAISSLLEDWTKKVSKYEDTKTSEIIRRLFDFRKRFGMI